MKVKLLLTPSAKIHGLPRPIPQEGQTVDLDKALAENLIYKNIAVPVAEPKQPAPKRQPKLKPEKEE